MLQVVRTGWGIHLGMGESIINSREVWDMGGRRRWRLG